VIATARDGNRERFASIYCHERKHKVGAKRFAGTFSQSGGFGWVQRPLFGGLGLSGADAAEQPLGRRTIGRNALLKLTG
jgi:hypothetical protein